MFEDIVYFKDKGFNLGFDTVHVSPKLKIVKGGDDKLNRKILEDKKTDILLDPEPKKWDKLHHRNSGLNQVLCKLAAQHDIAIGFSFRSILFSNNRGALMGKIMQNIRLCLKYKVKIIFGSFAEEKFEMRSAEDLLGFLDCLGMAPGDAKKALGNVSKILEDKEKVVKKGVRLAK